MEFVCLLEEMIVSDHGVNWVLGLRVFKAGLPLQGQTADKGPDSLSLFESMEIISSTSAHRDCIA